MASAPHPDQIELAAAEPPRRSAILVLLCLAQFMVILDITVINVALPEIGTSLGLSREALTWVVTGYTVTFGGLLILGGSLADAAGRKRVFLLGLALFVAASLTAGLADSGGLLLAGRITQGVGAALLSPAALSILTTEFTGADRQRALGVWAAIGAAGAAVGVLLGGALTAGPGWEWAFLINVPVGLLVGAGALAVVPARPPRRRKRVDLAGALLGTGTVGLLIYGVTRAGEHGWTAAATLLPILGAALLALLFVLVETRSGAPLVPLHLIGRQPTPGALAVMVVASGLLLSGFFLTSIYLQRAEGHSPLYTGLLFLPVALGTGAGAHLAAAHIGRTGPRPIAASGLMLGGAGFLLMSVGGVGGGVLTALLPGFVLAGVGLGASFVTATTTGLSRVDHQHAGVASGLFNTGHEVGASLGIAVASAVAAQSIAGAAGADLDGFSDAYLVAAATAAVLAGAAAVMLPRDKPSTQDSAHRFAH